MNRGDDCNKVKLNEIGWSVPGPDVDSLSLQHETELKI